MLKFENHSSEALPLPQGAPSPATSSHLGAPWRGGGAGRASCSREDPGGKQRLFALTPTGDILPRSRGAAARVFEQFISSVWALIPLN